MAKIQIYFGTERKAGSTSQRYVVVHDLYGDGHAVRVARDLTFDHLVGYLEGATAGRWGQVNLVTDLGKNPTEELAEHGLRPLAKGRLAQLLEKARLSEHYSQLLG